MSPRPENECAGCGDEIPDDASDHWSMTHCSETCYEDRPLGTGYSKSDHD